MSETTQDFKNYIGGEWVAAADGRTTENHDPATGALLGHFPRSGQADVDRAVAAAKTAFEGWRQTPAPKRGEILYRVGALLAERKEEIARILTSEMGKVLVEARGDVQEAIDMAYYMAGEGRRLFGAIVPSELPNKAAYGVRDPLGVIACVTPWNFPTAIPSWKSMAALIAGNTVVLKPATDTPHSALKLVEAFADAGLPPGALNLVMGSGSEVGMPLVRHPDVAGISFTGSNEVGREVNVEAARAFKRVTLELGGKNAIIVMDDADLDLAVEGILWSAFGTTGQRCTACSRLIVQKGARRELEERLVERATALRLGHGLDEQTQVGPLISKGQRERVHSYMQVARDDGARILDWRRDGDRGRSGAGRVLHADAAHRCQTTDARGAGRDLRPGPLDSRGRDVGGGDRGEQRHALRPLQRDLYTRHQRSAGGNARPDDGHRLHQRRDHRRGDPVALRRDARHRQRPPRGGPWRAGVLHRVEGDLRRLQRQASARAD